MLEAGSGSKSQTTFVIDIVGSLLDLTRDLGVRHSSSAKFLVRWEGNAKGSEEGVMYLGVCLTFLPPWRGTQMQGGGRGLVGVLLRQGKFRDVLPSSLERPAFRRIFVKLVAGFDPSVFFPWASERVGIRIWGECLKDGQSQDLET